jgi:hypothetical protein
MFALNLLSVQRLAVHEKLPSQYLYEGKHQQAKTGDFSRNWSFLGVGKAGYLN